MALNVKSGQAIGPVGPQKKKQTILGAITGKRGKKVSPHKGAKCASGQVYNQKLKKCVSKSGPAQEAYRAQRSRRTGEKTTSRRLMLGVHGTQK